MLNMRKYARKTIIAQKTKTTKKEGEEIITMVRHLWQAEMAYLKVDATYAENGDTKAISTLSETTEILITD